MVHRLLSKLAMPDHQPLTASGSLATSLLTQPVCRKLLPEAVQIMPHRVIMSRAALDSAFCHHEVVSQLRLKFVTIITLAIYWVPMAQRACTAAADCKARSQYYTDFIYTSNFSVWGFTITIPSLCPCFGPHFDFKCIRLVWRNLRRHFISAQTSWPCCHTHTKFLKISYLLEILSYFSTWRAHMPLRLLSFSLSAVIKFFRQVRDVVL